jgi:hypothetical protein
VAVEMRSLLKYVACAGRYWCFIVNKVGDIYYCPGPIRMLKKVHGEKNIKLSGITNTICNAVVKY